MIGNIIGIDNNLVLVKLTIDLYKVQNIINFYVIMEEGNKNMVGEIVDIKEGIAYINILGEIIDNNFVFGVVRKPSFGSSVKLISKEKIPLIIGSENYQEDKDLLIGKSPVYEDIDVSVDINQFFSNHFAIFGSTGSGKSCSISRMFQNLFQKKSAVPEKASILIFDAYGEYHNAFKDLNKTNPSIRFKVYTTNLNFPDSEILKIPLWLMGVDDVAILLGAEKHSQLPIIEKAIKLVTIFGREEELVIKHKNDIIARALLDILASGRPSVQIRDQIFSVLTVYNTKELNLDTPIYQPGYTRSLKQCLLIDGSGKIREMELLTNFIDGFLDENLNLDLPDGSFKYTLDDLKNAFDFSLISEGILKSDKIFDESNILRVRLHSLVNSENATYFDYPEYVSKDEYIRNLMIDMDGRKAQIVNFNINYVDDRLAKTITKVYCKLLFDYTKETDERAANPFHIILEEAHRYVQNDNDFSLLGYNIFDRITKEGRKYGIILGLVSQRPSELSETSLSQCSNFLIFKMLHPRDVEYIKQMVPNITNEIVSRLRILQPGTCVAFGSAFKVPIIVKFEMPDPEPDSSNANVRAAWFKKDELKEE